MMRYYLQDAQGNVIGMTDEQQNVTAKYQYDACGKTLVEYEDVPNPYRWGGAHGHYWDSDAGMYLLGLRWFDSFSGRFITRDPIGFASGDLNKYRFVGNNSANKTDSLGLGKAGQTPRTNQRMPYEPLPGRGRLAELGVMAGSLAELNLAINEFLNQIYPPSESQSAAWISEYFLLRSKIEMEIAHAAHYVPAGEVQEVFISVKNGEVSSSFRCPGMQFRMPGLRPEWFVVNVEGTRPLDWPVPQNIEKGWDEWIPWSPFWRCLPPRTYELPPPSPPPPSPTFTNPPSMKP